MRLIGGSHGIQREDSNDLVPFGSFVWVEAKLLGQPPGKIVDAFSNLEALIRLACHAASKGIV